MLIAAVVAVLASSCAMAQDVSTAFCARSIGAKSGILFDGAASDEVWLTGQAGTSGFSVDGTVLALGKNDTAFKSTGIRLEAIEPNFQSPIVLPWRNEILAIQGANQFIRMDTSDVRLFSLNGQRRDVAIQQNPDDIKVFNSIVEAVVPDFKMVVIRSRDYRLRSVLLGRDQTLQPIEPPPGTRLDRLVASGRDVLVSAYEYAHAPRKNMFGDLNQSVLLRLDEHGKLAVIARLPVNDMLVWPSQSGVLLDIWRQGPYLWSNGQLRPLAIEEGSSRFGILPPNAPFIDRGPNKPSLLATSFSIWSIDPAGVTRELWKRTEARRIIDAIDVDPRSGAAVILTPEGLAWIDDEGRIAAIPGGENSNVEDILSIKAVPFLRAILVETAAGYRVLDDDGVLRRIDRLPPSRSGHLSVWVRQQRVILADHGLGMVEIVRRAASNLGCGG